MFNVFSYLWATSHLISFPWRLLPAHLAALVALLLTLQSLDVNLSFSSPQQASRNTKSRLNASSLCFLDVIYLPLWYLLTNSTAIASFVVSSPKPLSALVIPMFPDCCTVPGTKYILQTNLTCLTQAALLESVFLCTLLSRQIPAHHQVPA